MIQELQIVGSFEELPVKFNCKSPLTSDYRQPNFILLWFSIVLARADQVCKFSEGSLFISENKDLWEATVPSHKISHSVDIGSIGILSSDSESIAR